MRVDLNTLKVGDKVRHRDGKVSDVIRIEHLSVSAFPVTIHTADGDTNTFRVDGTWALLPGDLDSRDIVKILKKSTEAPTANASSTSPAEYVSPTGAKRNSVGKAPLGYFPLDLAEGAAAVMAYGAGKYHPGNYRLGFPPVEALHSLMRHVAAVQAAVEADDKDGSAGLLLDAESGQAHIHHVVTSALILVQSMKKEGWKV